ncbi:restriction endonuclease [Sphingomonas desiccabilis]|uniref:Restriction endonuclease n=1 Tax=Sphingomonas desiccabilis TaxID=429134 RepID=A0A4Q2IV70_9SPHN|nr:restriction endonuclease [Sphingomonas desiccabilis]MBB3909755.1 restriction system protein [Sphingomonas desiccabilis]RXZ34445.1 restriction endonuclease [Sphingomonas desiccabilis]
MVEQAIWGIHMAQEHGTAPVAQGYVALGWSAVGDLRDVPPSREAFKAAYSATYPDAKPGNVAVSAGVLFRFANEMKEGDIIVYPSKVDRMVNIGSVSGDYRFDAALPEDCPNMRRVQWHRSIPRASFSQPALNEIGSALTLFRVSSNADEFLAALEGQAFEAAEIDEVSAERAAAQVQESTEDFIIKRLKTGQSSYQFEHFVAHLLKCMGYFSRVTQASGDGGVDIIAHRDELGFEPPIIKVQCKQVVSTIGRPEVQQLHGAIERGEHGLFVTLGGFSADARTFERTKPNLRLVDGETLIELIYAHYEKFEPRYQMLLPLTRSYVPSPVGLTQE